MGTDEILGLPSDATIRSGVQKSSSDMSHPLENEGKTLLVFCSPVTNFMIKVVVYILPSNIIKLIEVWACCWILV